MYDQYLHIYEKLPLGVAGLLMGAALIALHGYALLAPVATREMLSKIAENDKAGKVLLSIDFIWIFLLLLDVSWNPLRMNLFDFNSFRSILIVLCPIIWFVLHGEKKALIFPRALGLFLLLLAIVPLTAAFLKEPATRLLIPIWWYPVLTVAMFWVGKPYLLRDWAAWYVNRPTIYKYSNLFGLCYGALMLICSFFWF